MVQLGTGGDKLTREFGELVTIDDLLHYYQIHNGVRQFRYMWNGMMQGKNIEEEHIQQGNKKLNEKRIHLTQKPVNLYLWLLQKYAKAGWKILDTHVGSGSSLIACKQLGFDCVGFEINKYYFEAANNEACRQGGIYDTPS